MMDKKLIGEFTNPGSEYRGAPFWAWNGKLDPEELRRQIRVMRDMGLGGFFMHSRVGLDTEYLSKEWFKCVDACIDEAEKLDMQAWLYDEDRWPSGAAGGLVTKNPEYRRRGLIMEQIKKPSDLKTTSDTLAVFIAEKKKDKIGSYKKVDGKAPLKLNKDETLLHFYIEVDKCESWYNNQAYLDALNHDAVNEFIKVTHEAYRKNIGKEFGKRVPGIFTDEPNFKTLFHSMEGNKIGTAWTGKLPEAFKERYGYDVVERLPELFLCQEDEPVSQARYHYYDCVTHLFVDAFGRQIGEWCDNNNMLHTGHLLHEDTLTSQAAIVGNCMRFYEHMQAPGMDLLTEHRRIYDTAKQVSSAARQFGRKWRLTETYGCTGWDFPFSGHKALGDWQVALGINLRCQHLSWYTMEGEAKRDYPASIFYQSSWWEAYSKVEDYFARIHAAMTQGEEVRDLLVMHPIESMWTITGGKNCFTDEECVRHNETFIKMRDTLLEANIDFDYGDEELMSRHAKIKKGNVPKLIVGKADYKAVLVPSSITMRSSTLKLLKEFQAAGGLVVFAGNIPEYVDALRSEDVLKFAENCPRVSASGKDMPEAVEPIARRISITAPDKKEIAQTLYLLREDKENFYLFMCNTGHKKPVKPNEVDETMVRDRTAEFPEVAVRGFAECEGAPLELDPDSGEIFSANAKKANGEWIISTSLPALGSRLFVVPKKKTGQKAATRKALKELKSKKIKKEKWDIILSEDNVLALDTPRFKVADGKWQKAANVLEADYAVRDALGIMRRGGRMVQPWAREKTKDLKRTTVELAYSFDVDVIPSGALFLGIEKPETFKISVNGTKLSSDAECGWWCDRSLRKLPVDPNLLLIGKNEIKMSCDYSEKHPGLEIVYLLGNFGAKAKGSDTSMIKAPASLKIGDWVKQGLPFYSGSVSYCCDFNADLKKDEKLFVKIPSYRGTLAKVYVNGKCAGTIAWEPNEANISDLAKNGKNTLRIEIASSRRNSHGPLHLTEKWPSWTGPAQFVPGSTCWQDAYQLVPCGMMAEPELSIRS